MKVLKLLSKSRNSEVNAATGRICDAYHGSSVEGDATLAPIFDEIDPKNLELTEAVKRMKAESDLEAKDEVRDNNHHAFYFFVYGATFSKDITVKSAAISLFTIPEYYGLGITEENYDTESSLMDSLLADLAKPEYETSISALPSCADLIADLQTSQDAFKAARLVFQQEQAQEGQLVNATAVKRQVVNIVNTSLITVLNGLLISSPATYAKFGATVAQIINENNEVVKKRKNLQAKIETN